MTAPFVPGQPNTPPQQPAGHPAPAPAPKPKPTFWQTLPGALTIVGICAAVIGLLFLLPMLGPNGNDLDVDITSCKVSSAGNATVSATVKNNADRTVTAKLDIEYRDGSGARLDTDTMYVRNIAAGDTARADEMTNLDATASSITCKLAGASIS